MKTVKSHLRLGNSRGQNIGKKYLMRCNLPERKLTSKDYAKADALNEWYIKGSERLKSQFAAKNSYDEDIFTDTYIYIWESVVYGNTVIKNYANYFARAYFTNHIKHKKENNRFVDAAFLLENIVEDENNTEEQQTRTIALCNDILTFCKENLPAHSLEIFQYWCNGMLTQKKITQKDVATNLNVHPSLVSRQLRKARIEIIKQFKEVEII